MSYYRIHRRDESLETILDTSRPDGWVVEGDGEIRGLAVCDSLEGLLYYVREYGMTVEPGDRLVAVDGRYVGPDHDAHAVRVEATGYEVVCDAREWLDAIEAARAWGAELEEAIDEWIDTHC